MERNPTLTGYLHELKVQELMESLKQQGYTVAREQPLGRYRFDIVAEKPGKTLVVEVKAGSTLRAGARELASMAEYVRSLPDGEFQLVVAPPPQERNIEVAGLAEVLRAWVADHHPRELHDLSAGMRIEGIHDVDVTEIRVDRDQMIAAGRASVAVSVPNDAASGREDGVGAMYDSFPLAFEVALDRELRLSEVRSLSIDTASVGR